MQTKHDIKEFQLINRSTEKNKTTHSVILTNDYKFFLYDLKTKLETPISKVIAENYGYNPNTSIKLEY